MSRAILSLSNVSVRFGGISALERVSFDLGEGEIVGLIGPNGAGKTTIFNCLSRFVNLSHGSIAMAGESIERTPAWKIPQLGIARTFQNVALCPNLSVLDNVCLGAHCRMRSGFLANALRLPSAVKEEREAQVVAKQALDQIGLSSDGQKTARELPYVLQKRIEIARALAMRPRLLLLDEPAGGLSHSELGELSALIRSIARQYALSLLIVEHHMEFIMGISNRIVVLNYGKKIADGVPAEIKTNSEVIQAYLGDR